MMSTDSLASALSPHHGGQNHESTDINPYRDHDENGRRNRGIQRHALKAARPDCFRTVRLVHRGWLSGGEHD